MFFCDIMLIMDFYILRSIAMRRLSLIYPVITYRAKLKRNLSFIVSDGWIAGQLYSDASGKKYLLAGPAGSDEHQRFYDIDNLRLETVGMASPFKSNSNEILFDGDIINVTAFERSESVSDFNEYDTVRQLINLESDDIEVKKAMLTSVPDGSKILFSSKGIVRNYNGSFFFEYSDPQKNSLGTAVLPLYQLYAPNMEPLDNHIITLTGNVYDNPQLAQQILYSSSASSADDNFMA